MYNIIYSIIRSRNLVIFYTYHILVYSIIYIYIYIGIFFHNNEYHQIWKKINLQRKKNNNTIIIIMVIII